MSSRSPEGLTEKRPELREDFPADLAVDLGIGSDDVFLGRIPHASAECSLYSVIHNVGYSSVTVRDLIPVTGEDSMVVFSRTKDAHDVQLIFKHVADTDIFRVLSKAFMGDIPDPYDVRNNFTPEEAVGVVAFAIDNERRMALKEFKLGNIDKVDSDRRVEESRKKFEGAILIAKSLGFDHLSIVGGTPDTSVRIIKREVIKAINDLKKYNLIKK